MSFGLSAPVLVLNRSFQPVRITSARRAFVMLYVGSARALDAGLEPYDFHTWARLPAGDGEAVRTPSGALRVPRVMQLIAYNRVPRTGVRLSRRNIFLRDGFRCQYCAERPPQQDLNLDHVIPRSRGGKSTWENLVTSCRSCNVEKGWSTPDECGMRPLRAPARPTWSALAQIASVRRRFVEWEPFLGGIAGLDAIAEAV